jgi:hypothetical protein
MPVVGLGEQKLLVIAARRMLDLRSRSRQGPLVLHGEMPVVGLGEKKLLVIAARRMLDLRSRPGKGFLALHGDMPVARLGEQKLLVIAAGIRHGSPMSSECEPRF